MNNTTLDQLKNVSDFFDHKKELYKILNNELENYKDYLLKLNNSNIELTRNSIISINEYKNNNDNIKTLLDKHSSIIINFKYLDDESFLEVKKNIDDLKNNIIENCNILSLKSLKVNLKLINLDFQNNEINFYDKIFNVINFKIKSKDEYDKKLKEKEEKYIFFEEINDNYNSILQLFGINLSIYINNKVISFFGYLNDDNNNLIKKSNFFINKYDKISNLLDLNYINNYFKENYLNNILLKDFIILSNDDIISKIKKANKYNYLLKQESLSSLISHFSKSNIYNKREILITLLISDKRSFNLGNLLLDILSKKENKNLFYEIFFSLSFNLQHFLEISKDNFKEELNNFEEDDVSYEKKILCLNTSDNIKKKALNKLKSMNSNNMIMGSSNNDSKVQQWIDGLINIPFGIYKTNNILIFLNIFKEKINNFILLINDKLNFNLDKVDTDYNINNFIIEYYDNEIIKNNKIIFDNINVLKTEWENYLIERKHYIKNIRYELDKYIYGNEKSKILIESIISQWLNGNQKGNILGFHGPPGVGKTTFAKNAISNILFDNNNIKRPFIFIPLGGSTNGSTLEGHNFTYVGSTWGKIVEALIDSKCLNPILFFDELDKVSNTEHGREIISILTHITDETQNSCFYDKYFAGIEIDLSKCLIIFSYNDRLLIDQILRDRITEIEIESLDIRDKINIYNKFINKEILEDLGLKKNDFFIKETDVIDIIENYTYEAGIRKFKEKIKYLFRILNLERFKSDNISIPYLITNEKINEILHDFPKINYKKINNKSQIGMVNGLFATNTGIGGLTIIQTTKYYSETKLSLELTGKQGDVMKESIKCSKTIALNLIPDDILDEINNQLKERSWGIHIHTPDTSTPKDGPSAGGALTLSIISLLTNIPVRNDVAMTGEIDLNGNITKIGGLSAKLLGAQKAGIKKVLIPKENEQDLNTFNKKNKLDNMEVILVDSIFDILKHSLIKNKLKFKKII